MCSAPDERRVLVEISPEKPGQQPGLQMDEQPHGGSFVEKRMPDFILLALLVGHQDRLAGVVVHPHRPGLGYTKTGRPDLPPIDQTEDEPIDQERTEFLHQIERKRRTAGTVTVQEPHLGIQPDRLAGAAGIVTQHAVQERQQRIDGIEWRTAAATVHRLNTAK